MPHTIAGSVLKKFLIKKLFILLTLLFLLLLAIDKQALFLFNIAGVFFFLFFVRNQRKRRVYSNSHGNYKKTLTLPKTEMKWKTPQTIYPEINHCIKRAIQTNIHTYIQVDNKVKSNCWFSFYLFCFNIKTIATITTTIISWLCCFAVFFFLFLFLCSK